MNQISFYLCTSVPILFLLIMFAALFSKKERWIFILNYVAKTYKGLINDFYNGTFFWIFKIKHLFIVLFALLLLLFSPLIFTKFSLWLLLIIILVFVCFFASMFIIGFVLEIIFNFIFDINDKFLDSWLIMILFSLISSTYIGINISIYNIYFEVSLIVIILLNYIFLFRLIYLCYKNSIEFYKIWACGVLNVILFFISYTNLLFYLSKIDIHTLMYSGGLIKDSFVKGYFDILYYTIVTFFTIGFGDIQPISIIAKITTIFIILTGFICNAIMIGILISTTFSSRKKYSYEEKNKDIILLEKLGYNKDLKKS